MQNPFKKRGKVTKGAPSGFVISLLVHGAIFFFAGLFVVFTVLPKSPPAFEPPPAVARPIMKLKKPKIKIKKSAQPKPSSRIVAKVKTAKMPEIQIPDLMGTGEGLLGGLGGGGGELMDIPDPGETSTFGSFESTGSDFIGKFYDPKRFSTGSKSMMGSRYAGGEAFVEVLYNFLKRKMDPAVLDKYYHSPRKLYTTTFCMPPDLSLMAPSSFGEPDTLGCLWLVHYKGKLVYPDDITFRFVGAADDIMAVMVDNEYALISNTWEGSPPSSAIDSLWDDGTVPYPLGIRFPVRSEWITLKAGEFHDMEVAIAEIPGGNFQSILCVEVQGVDYPKNKFGGNILPVFKTDEVSADLRDAIYSMSWEGDFCLTNGPIFRDYMVNSERRSNRVDEVFTEVTESRDASKGDASEMRMWKTVDGKEIEAKMISIVFDSIYLEKSNGEQVKLPKKALSEESLEFVAQEKHPEFKVTFLTGRDMIPAPEQPPDTWYRPITVISYEFGVKVEQKDRVDYPYPLTIEYYAFGDEVGGDNYRLLDYHSSVFTPSAENNRTHVFRGKKTKTKRHILYPGKDYRGYDYCGYLVTITDERGEIIQYYQTRNFLYEHLDALKKLKAGNYFNERCERVTPARSKPSDRPTCFYSL